MEGTSEATFPKAKIDWRFLARCLSLGSSASSLFETALEKACMLGAYPCEVIAGTPRARYGARITLLPPVDKSAFFSAFGLDRHPWGPPGSVGLRTNDKGELIVKPYHQVVQGSPLSFHEKLRGELSPILAALHEGAIESYFQYTGSLPWNEFVDSCLAGFSTAPPRVDFQPSPRSVPRSFFASVNSRNGEVKAITVYADYHSLPDDETISRLWTRDMPDAEREAYEFTLATVRSCGARRFGGWHAVLAWSFEHDGIWHKAASLRFPVNS